MRQAFLQIKKSYLFSFDWTIKMRPETDEALSDDAEDLANEGGKDTRSYLFEHLNSSGGTFNTDQILT